MTRSQYALLIIGLSVLVVGSISIDRHITVSSMKPFRPVCWLVDAKDLKDFTPAYWIERNAMKHMDYEITRNKCRGEVAGHMMEWESDQFWLRRTGVAKVTTR